MYIKSYKIFESTINYKLIDVTSMDEFKKSFAKEFKSNTNWWDSEKFKAWDDYLQNGWFDGSKYMVLDDKIIGGFLIVGSSVSDYYDIIANNETTSNLKVHRNPKDFSDNGIYLEYIFVKSEFRNAGLAKEMVEEIQKLGYDYMWEQSVDKVASKYWIDKIQRKILFEYDDTEESFGRTYVTYKEL